MNEPLSPLELLPEEEGGANLTYFAFAAPTASAPDLPAVLPGPLPDVLSGRYRLERMLGAGGMGTVYRARDLLHEQFGDPAPLVALKLLNESVAESPDASALLYSEFALTRRLRHPNVVRLFTFDVDTACQRAYIVMELMPGLPLDRLLCERPEGLPWSELSAIARPLLDVLAYVHEQGVLHGDLKPSNVMLGERACGSSTSASARRRQASWMACRSSAGAASTPGLRATPLPNCSRARHCRRRPTCMRWPASSTNWPTVAIRSAACPRTRPGSRGWSASCARPDTCLGAAGRRCVPP